MGRKPKKIAKPRKLYGKALEIQNLKFRLDSLNAEKDRLTVQWNSQQNEVKNLRATSSAGAQALIDTKERLMRAENELHTLRTTINTVVINLSKRSEC